MNVGTNGILVDQHGNVLLIKRNDTRTYAPPGGALDAGELLPDAAAREVREETGLIVLPVRLAAVSFTFRCLLRGGDITTSEESPVVGFFKANPLPRRMSSFHRERVEKTLHHAEIRPLLFNHSVSPFTNLTRFLLRNVVYRWLDVKRKLHGQPPYQPSPTWTVEARLLIKNESGAYLWHRPDANTAWLLPGGETTGLMAPWETAVHLAQQQTQMQLSSLHLTDVYLTPDASHLTLAFEANAPQNLPQNSTNLSWFSPGEEPEACAPIHLPLVANLHQTEQPTQFHTLPNHDFSTTM